MAGIYVHIPFCKSRCIYCGFFSTTSVEKCHIYVDAVVAELEARKGELKGETIETIYFGGGTPSQLPPDEVERLLSAVLYIYNVREGAEITLEANPDDVTPALLSAWRSMGINRLSMGVQTFHDQRLRFLNRRHTATQAIQAVRSAQQAGFNNLSIDLMFGFPDQTLDEWKRDVKTALSLGVQHLSAYSLMYEEGTRLNQLLEQGEITELDEELSVQMYDYLIQALTDAGYRHYELSNFALPGRESRHNSSYWHGIPYLGVGAGAHSFDGQQRSYHPDSLEVYLRGEPLVVEHLTEAERYDEFVFTGLRTAEGIRLDILEEKFGKTFKDYCLRNAQKQIDAGKLVLHDPILRLSHSGLFVSNDVMSDLMWV
ncbi:MAG: radical SAM family heme chaperone HemW [Bacteroidaceae bacterium]|nr:radical SAM family heme chaperone HemW [Bacteroidaceae bacterium]